jgi:hypothetical protein
VVPREEIGVICQHHNKIERFMGDVDARIEGLESDMVECKEDRRGIRADIVGMKVELKGAVTRVGLIIAAIALIVGPLITAIITKAMGPKGP